MIIEKFALPDKVAIVTGGGTGLGRSMALALAEAGADVVLAARRVDPLNETAALIKKMGRHALAVPTDVTKSDQVNRMVESALKTFGRIDILINNAGVAKDWGDFPIDKITDKDWRVGIDVDLSGAFYCSRAVSREMVKKGGGKIINISTMSALTGFAQTPVYGIAKAGMINMTRLFAVELAPHKVLVNCIICGFFRTASSMGEQEENMEAAKKMGRFVPVGRIGEPAEMGPLALLLASSASDYITGQNFIIDGGTQAGRFAPSSFVLPTREVEQL
ncbi:MAG: SDR family NAD(P)-dependent oxidoreductase [Smithellaceae bacterium]